MDRWKIYWKIKEYTENEAVYLRRGQLVFNGAMIVFALFLALLSFLLRQQNESAPSFIFNLSMVIIFAAGWFLTWRGKLWQSVLTVSLCLIISASFVMWMIPSLRVFAPAVYLVVLLYVSIFFRRQLVDLFALLTLFTLISLYYFPLVGGADITAQLVISSLPPLALFVLGYLLIRLNMENHKRRAEALRLSQTRFRRLFELSPVALWEQDGSAMMARIRQLRAAGVTDFRAYFEQHPAEMFAVMAALKILDVNETAVSLYKAKDKTELMSNLTRLLPEESDSFVLDSLEAMINGESYFEQEIPSLTVHGEKLTVLYSWSSPVNQDEPYATIVSSVVDVSARKQVEDALKHYSERLHRLHELDLAIKMEKSPEAIAAVSLTFISQFMPAWGAEVWEYEPVKQTVAPLATVLAQAMAKRPFYDQSHPLAFILSEEMQDEMRVNRPYIVDDLWALRYLPPALAALKKSGIHSFMQLPLLVRGELLGFLHLYDTAVNAFTPEYIGIVREFAAPLATALGNVQLFVAENKARNQAETLRQVAAELNMNLELEPLLQHILGYLEEVVPFDSATIFLEAEDSLKIVAQWGLSENMLQEAVTARGKQLSSYAVYSDAQPKIISDTRKYAKWIPIPGLEHIRCWMGIPLQVRGKTIGVLALDKSIAGFYDESNLELAVAFANQAAVAIENARLYKQARQYAEDLEIRVDERTRDLSTLYEITAVATAHLNLEKILDDSLPILLSTLACTYGVIHVVDEESQFQLKSQVGIPDRVLPIISVVEQTNTLVKKVVEKSTPLFIRDLAISPALSYLHLPLNRYSYIGVSIRVKDEVVGILSMVHGDGKQFSMEDIALASSVADQLGVVIENGRLRQQNQKIAVLQERERLARELHDSVTQSLYSLTLFAEASRDLSESTADNGEKLREYLGDIGTTAQQALKEMRLMLYELQSDVLVEEGLVDALRYRLEAVEGRSGIDAHLEAQIDIPIPEALRRTLYLIAQEALNNTLKHAKATEVFITLEMQAAKLQMTIADNGCGFSPDSSGSGGMGLKTMQDRIESVGGSLSIHSTPHVGTKIELSVDLQIDESRS